MFVVNDFCSRYKDRGAQVSTDIECLWDKPRSRSTPLEVDDIDIRNDTRTPKKVIPTHTNLKSTVNSLNSEEPKLKLQHLCKGSNALLLQKLYEDGDDTEDEIFDVPAVFGCSKFLP